MPDILWEEPPASIRPTKWLDPLNTFRANPGRRGRIETFDTFEEAQRLATTLRNLAKKLGGEWEITPRRIPEGGAGVWVKFTAPERPPVEIKADPRLLSTDERGAAPAPSTPADVLQEGAATNEPREGVEGSTGWIGPEGAGVIFDDGLADDDDPLVPGEQPVGVMPWDDVPDLPASRYA